MIMLNEKWKNFKSGTDIRGIAVDAEGFKINLTDDVVTAMVNGYIIWLSEKKGVPSDTLKISVGRDSRISGKHILDLAVETMLKAAIARFPTKKIGYIFIYKCVYLFDSRVENSYYDAAKKCCEKWGIPYCDLNTQTLPLNYIEALRTAYTANGDGYHPNEQGYKLFYVPKITAWLKTL